MVLTQPRVNRHVRVKRANGRFASGTVTRVAGTDLINVRIGHHGEVLTNRVRGLHWTKGRSGFVPSQVAGLHTWVRADALTLNDGDAISSCPDITGKDPFTNTGSNRPTFKTNIVNGKPVMRFVQASTQGLLRTTGLPTGTSGSMYIVFKPTGTAGTRTLFGAAKNTAVNVGHLADTDGNKLGVFQRNADTADQLVGSTVLALAWTIMSLHSNGTSYEMLFNGTPQTFTPTTGSNTGDWFGDCTGLTTLSFGTLYTSTPGFVFDGDIAEIVLYDGVTLTTQQRTDVRTYLGAKYGIAVS